MPLGNHLGRWRYIGPDDSRNAYELKTGNPPIATSAGVSTELIIGIVIGLILFFLLTLIIFATYKRMMIKLTRNNKLTEEEIRQFLDGVLISTTGKMEEETPGENVWRGVPYNNDFELEKDKFTIDRQNLLGSGASGSVYSGRIDGLVDGVAFKMTRADCPVSALKNLLSEIKILSYLGKHENIVSLCGSYTAELRSAGIVYVATELCNNGSLESYLRTNNSSKLGKDTAVRYVSTFSSVEQVNITDSRLFQWTIEISSAMEYISSKNVIHADLATRNVLLNSNLTAKVTDFGLSRHLYEYTEYVKKQQEPLPWRWMAPESLKQLEFSTKSDVWSFGVTLWEIFSMGDIPYPGLSWDVNFVGRLEAGLRMPRPARASLSMYQLMTNCWNLQSNQRPTFEWLKDALLTLEAHLNASMSSTNESESESNNQYANIYLNQQKK